MRRAAVQAFRTTFQYTVRGLGRRPFTTCILQTSSAKSPTTRRLLSTTQRRTLKHHKNNASSGIPPPRLDNSIPLPPPLQSSMYYRRAGVVLASALVGYGAWYSYNDGSPGNVNNVSAKRGYTTDTSTADSSLPTRNVLVISADQLHTGTIVGDGPISKTTSEDGTRVIEMLNPEQATEKLRKLEESYLVNRGQGVVRYDLVQLPSNDPIEDDHTEKIIEIEPPTSNNGGNDWMFWGVFDGHSGWTTSAKLRQTLVSFVARELNQTYQKSDKSLPGTEAVDAAIKSGFLKLDDEIVNQSVQKVLQANNKTMAAELLAPALSGSCALLSFYDSRSKLLRVACTGDSRAVLGRRQENGKWTATPLSIDQTGSNLEEANRLRKEHPNEPYVVRNGRILGGLEPSRAFGDASYKWTREISDKLRKHFFARSVSNLLRTPPYVTAEPIITTTKIEPEKGDFVVMATDGLWEMLTNEEVIGLVGKWIDAQQQNKPSSSSPGLFDSVWSKAFGSSSAAQSGLPVEVAKMDGPEGQRAPFRGVRQWGGNDGFVVEDLNVATHLVRNALGGKNREQVSALLTLPAPFSRRYRDDLTVQVIFFGEGEQKGGEVVPNNEAMKGLKGELKAKL
ncbi:phosphatase 2C-like domain-containing protein [Triangularia verruculosa]|uniref:Phosphatase 2C-like domain-containing protein n=1 Tax=Triangularia verruculosa TaxID=2587418 RepID=A0AAN7AZS3_9PEZI|nr:phosphatase 2C-like domain-containing protein [Triangularia verruculosa]